VIFHGGYNLRKINKQETFTVGLPSLVLSLVCLSAEAEYQLQLNISTTVYLAIQYSCHSELTAYVMWATVYPNKRIISVMQHNVTVIKSNTEIRV